MNQSFTLLLLLILLATMPLKAQITERERPAEWEGICEGARFLDRFLPIQAMNNKEVDVWGADYVKPRYTDNGIEDSQWSYWGGNMLQGDDGEYHLFVCRWKESSEKGHMEWPRSKIVHAVASNSFGPFTVKETIGDGHNPEAYRLANGGYVIAANGCHYYANTINGPWEKRTFDFDARNRKIPDGLSNLTFAQREDGSYIMMCRGGSIWISKDGKATYNLVTPKSVYPPFDGRYEDPVIWKTNIQYHMIVHDWLGRIAYYQRSADGIHWKLEPGEAYIPGMAKYDDGTFEDWFKFERIKVFQDEYGRATQANFAVIDTLKHNDLSNDRHSSKNIVIPLSKGKLITILNEAKITDKTEHILVRIESEKGFNPRKDIDFNTLRFGASEEVNFGRGCTLLSTKKQGKHLILEFSAKGSGLTEANFAAKLLGKTKKGELLFGYARLPKYEYLKPHLSARLPEISIKNNNGTAKVIVENFGQSPSKEAEITIEYRTSHNWKHLASGKIAPINPYEQTAVTLPAKANIVTNEILNIRVTIKHPQQKPESLEGLLSITNFSN